MNRVLFVLTLLIAFAFFSVNKKTEKNQIAERADVTVFKADNRSLNKISSGEVKTTYVHFGQEKVYSGLSGILLMLTNSKEKSKGSHPFWWNYLIANSSQAGC
jgi:hypothetical protein